MAKPLKSEDEIFYEMDTAYEITLNPQKQYESSTVNRLAKCQAQMSHIVSLLSTTCEIDLYTEISEPRYGNIERGSSSRIHYHGVIKFKKSPHAVGLFLLNHINILKKTCDYSINRLRPDKWRTYCTKQQHIMEPLCKLYKVPYKITTSNPYNPIIKNQDNQESFFDRWTVRDEIEDQ